MFPPVLSLELQIVFQRYSCMAEQTIRPHFYLIVWMDGRFKVRENSQKLSMKPSI
jgi:hypothetical protein